MYKESFTQGNYSKGRIIKPIGIVLHHNYLNEIDLYNQMTKLKPILSNGDTVVPASYHCVGWKDGRRSRFAEDTQRAWHAGKSEFNGMKYCNNFMLGYCFYGNSNKDALSNDQIESFIEWFIPRMETYRIPKSNVVDHRMVAPNRKVDLNIHQYNRVMSSIDKLWL